MADRAPLAGWRRQSDALSTIEYGDELWASVYRSPVAGAFIWYASVDPKIRRGEINNVVAAKLAAEDAARALVADMAAALGGRVVWADWAVFEAALRGEPHSPARRLEYETAMDAYRARMARDEVAHD